MGKRNHEWEQASAWDGFFTQDKPGGVTQRVDPALVFARLLSEGFLKDTPEYLLQRLSNFRDILWNLSVDGESIESTLFQISGLGAQLVPVETDFAWSSSGYMGGRGISPGRVYIGGVDSKIWTLQEAYGKLHFTTDNWRTSTPDTSLQAYMAAEGASGTSFPVVKFVHMAGAVNKDAWVCGGDDGLLRVAYHLPENYNSDGTLTLKESAWFTIVPPFLVADIGSDGTVACMVGNHGAIMRTTDWVTFTTVYGGPYILGGIDTDRYGNWFTVERDTGRVLRSVDNGLNWTAPEITLDGVPVATLPTTGSVTAGNGIWLAAGANHYEYSEDGLHWFSGTNALGSFYGCGFDGSRFYATEPDTSNAVKVYQLLVSEVAVQRHLSALKGLTVVGDTWLPDLPSAAVLQTDENGRVSDGSATLLSNLAALFVSLTADQAVTGVKDFVDGLAAESVAFDTTPDALPHQAGRTHWDSVDQTLATDLPGGVTLQHGQEVLALGLNKTGATLTNGTVVYCSGSQAFRTTFAKAEADVGAHSLALAVLTQDVENNGQGFGTAFGLVRDLNTSAFTEGAVLYLSTTAGEMTETRPAAPNVGVRIGLCVRSHPTQGMVFVAIDRFPTLAELSDARISSPASGQVLSWDGTKWVNAPAATYSLPIASPSVLGGVKVGANLSIDGVGILSAPAPTAPYTLPTASPTILGGVKVGARLSVDGSGVLAAADQTYTLPQATDAVLGGVKVGRGLQVSAGVVTDNDSNTFKSDNAGAAGAGKWTKVLSISGGDHNDYLAFRLQVTTSYTAVASGTWKIDIEPRQGAATPTPSVRMIESDGAAAGDVVVVVVADYPTAPRVYEVWTRALSNNVETGWTVRDLHMVGGSTPPVVTYYDITPWAASYTAGAATAGTDARGLLVLGTTSTTAARGDQGATAYAHSQVVTGNPHGTTAADVGAVPTSQKGAANGVATLDASTLVPAAQLPVVARPYDAVATDDASFLAAMQSAAVESIWVRGTAVNLAGSVTVGTQKRIYGEGVGFTAGLTLTVSAGAVRFRNNKIDVNGAVTINGSQAFYTRKFNGSNTITYSGSSSCNYELTVGTTVTGGIQTFWDNSNTNTNTGTAVAAKYASTQKPAGQTANVSLFVGSSTQWSAHATMLVPDADVALVQNTSKMAVVCPQPVSGASYILAIYAWPDTGTTATLVAQTAVQTMPGGSSWLEGTMTSASVTLTGGKRYFFAVLWNGNGATLSGTNGAALNVQPYLAFHKANLGVLSTAPATLVPEGEQTAHFFGRVVV